MIWKEMQNANYRGEKKNKTQSYLSYVKNKIR